MRNFISTVQLVTTTSNLTWVNCCAYNFSPKLTPSCKIVPPATSFALGRVGCKIVLGS